jgi:hypothetical protein
MLKIVSVSVLLAITTIVAGCATAPAPAVQAEAPTGKL